MSDSLLLPGSGGRHLGIGHLGIGYPGVEYIPPDTLAPGPDSTHPTGMLPCFNMFVNEWTSVNENPVTEN